MGLEPVELAVRIGVASVSGRHARVQMQQKGAGRATVRWGFPKTSGTFLGGPHSKGYNSLRSILGCPCSYVPEYQVLLLVLAIFAAGRLSLLTCWLLVGNKGIYPQLKPCILYTLLPH